MASAKAKSHMLEDQVEVLRAKILPGWNASVEVSPELVVVRLRADLRWQSNPLPHDVMLPEIGDWMSAIAQRYGTTPTP